VLALALLLAACGGSTGSSAPSTTAPTPTAAADDPSPPTPVDGSASSTCASDAEVSAVVGAGVALDASSDDEIGCHYYSDDGVVSVGVVVEEPASRTIEDVERNIEVDRVDGVGDEAYVSISPGGITQFGVFAGARHVLVTVQGVDADASTGQAVYELFA
jgi:hypothetical protein